MPGGDYLNHLTGICYQLLGAAVAVYLAVQIIEAMWLCLLLISIGVALLVGGITAIRRRQRGW